MDLSAIHITRWGSVGPRVVMVHGGVQGSTVGGEVNFVNQKRLGDDGFQLIIPDRPGHGRTPNLGWPDDAARDGEWVADLLGDGAHLVGHSFGGAVALAAAARRPGAVRSLTVIEPAMLAVASDDPAVRKFLFGLVRAIYLSFSATTRAERVFRHLGIPAAQAGQHDAATRERLGRNIKRIRLPAKRDLLQQLGVVRDAGIPLLVVTAGWSPGFDAASARVASLGGGRHVIVRAPHHFPQIVSDEFTALLAGFMRDADARPTTMPAPLAT